MRKKKDKKTEPAKKRARGGLAAEAMAAKEAKPEPNAKPERKAKEAKATEAATDTGGGGKVSKCSLLRLLGKHGVKYPQAKAILDASKIDSPESTIRLNLSAGARGVGSTAQISDMELQGLLAIGAPTPGGDQAKAAA